MRVYLTMLFCFQIVCIMDRNLVCYDITTYLGAYAYAQFIWQLKKYVRERMISDNLGQTALEGLSGLCDKGKAKLSEGWMTTSHRDQLWKRLGSDIQTIVKRNLRQIQAEDTARSNRAQTELEPETSMEKAIDQVHIEKTKKVSKKKETSAKHSGSGRG